MMPISVTTNKKRSKYVIAHEVESNPGVGGVMIWSCSLGKHDPEIALKALKRDVWKHLAQQWGYSIGY